MSNWFSWHHSPVQYVINPASGIFNGALNEVGRTYPVINGVRTWTGMADAATEQIANAINGPAIERMRTSVRLTQPGRNVASAVINTPGNEPWNAPVDVQAVRAFASGTAQSCEAIRGILHSLPASGSIAVSVLGNVRFTASTLEHERRHASDIRQVCEEAFSAWNEAISSLSEQWFPSEAAMDQALFRLAGLTEWRGSRIRRLAERMFLRLGFLADDLHLVRDRYNQFMISDPHWIATERTLEFSLVEAPLAVANRVFNRSRISRLA